VAACLCRKLMQNPRCGYQLSVSLQAVILVGALSEGALLTLLQLPAAASPLWLPLLAGAWALLFPIALLLQVKTDRCSLLCADIVSACSRLLSYAECSDTKPLAAAGY
jgi:hypothetical protein